MIFDSTDTYISTDELSMAVDAAVKLERPLLVKGEPRHRQDAPGRGDCQDGGPEADSVAHQVEHQGHQRAVRVRCRIAFARLATRRCAGGRHPQLHQEGQALGSLRVGRARRAAHRRDRQGRHRVPQRPVAGTRPHGVLRLRVVGDRYRETTADRGNHVQQRKGAAGTPFCGAASSTTSTFRTATPCTRSSKSTSRRSSETWSRKPWKSSSMSARCRA